MAGQRPSSRGREPTCLSPETPVRARAETWHGNVCLQGLSLVLSEGSVRDGEEKEPPMEEDPGDPEALRGYQWLLRDLPRLPLFDSVRPTTALALQQVGAADGLGGGGHWPAGGAHTALRAQAIHMETDPQTVSAYLVYLSQHTPVEEQGQHSDLALVRGRGWAGPAGQPPGLGAGGRGCTCPTHFPGTFCPQSASRAPGSSRA